MHIEYRYDQCPRCGTLKCELANDNLYCEMCEISYPLLKPVCNECRRDFRNLHYKEYHHSVDLVD